MLIKCTSHAPSTFPGTKDVSLMVSPECQGKVQFGAFISESVECSVVSLGRILTRDQTYEDIICITIVI